MRVILGAILLALPAAAQEAKPNIVFILADDLGINELSCYGRKDQPTPHLDRLASEGMRFTSAYCAQPICSPSRAALMTGLAPARLHLTTFLPGRADAPSQLLLHPKIQMQLPREEVTIAERLKEAGYATGCVGKWHLGNKGFLPTDQGFDVYHPGQANTTPSAAEGGKGEVGLTAAAEKFIEENKDRPFYLFLPHNNPHIPLAARAELIEKHKDAFNPVYAAVIEELDNAVGRLMAKLEAAGVAGRTIVIFSSDNGGLHVLEMAKTPATYNAPFRAGKGFTYEGGLRIPLIVRWPGKIKAGSVTDAPTINTDWVPTLLELTGVKSESKFDGASIAGLLLRGEAPPQRAIYWHYPHYTNQGSVPTGAVREGDWKLIEHYEDGRLELFNLAQDVSETADLSAKEPARVAALRGKLEAWRRETKAQENSGNPAYNASLWKRIYRDTDVTTLAAKATSAEVATTLDAWRKLMNGVLSKPASEPGAGAVILHARDAKVTGTKLRYEPEPHKDTLGFWTDAGDRAEWSFEAPNAGTFEVVVLQGCGKGSAGSEVEVAVGGQALAFTVEETGHFQRFIPRAIGTVKLEKGPATLTVRAKSKPGVAVMDLRRIVLRAAP